MMQLIVEIKDPYGLGEKKDPYSPSLAAGTFVDVHIRGRMLKDVIIIPRSAFRDNWTAWIMDQENTLRIREVSPLRIERDQVIVGEGIEEGELIIKTNISGAANGMKLRPMQEE
jgi:multidrug efflux pump subunit AcrA (membrane-fusion protein)